MDNKMFGIPDPNDAKRFMESLEKKKEARAKGFFKIVEGENMIRILPQKPNSVKGVSYFATGNQHFIQHTDGSYEIFTCNKETYNKPCPVCEERIRLYQAGDREAAKKRGMRPSQLVIYQVIDRKAPVDQQTVKIFRAGYSVFVSIMYLIKSGGTFSNLIYSPMPQGQEEKFLGRDLIIIYNKQAPAQMKYSVMPQELTPLGTAEQIALWNSQLVDLTTEAFFPEIDYDEARIRAFGSIEERAALVKLLEEFEIDSEENKEETQAASTPIQTVPQGQPTAETKVAQPVQEPVKVEQPKPAEAPKPVESKPKVGMNFEDIKAKVLARRAKK